MECRLNSNKENRDFFVKSSSPELYTNNLTFNSEASSLDKNLSEIPQQFNDSFKEKWTKYHVKRKEIFCDELNVNNLKSSSSFPPNQILRVRNRHRELKKEYRVLHVDELEGDSRPFADVKLFGVTIHGLMDSGASISVLGSGSLEFLKEHNVLISN